MFTLTLPPLFEPPVPRGGVDGTGPGGDTTGPGLGVSNPCEGDGLGSDPGLEGGAPAKEKTKLPQNAEMEIAQIIAVLMFVLKQRDGTFLDRSLFCI